VRRPATALGVLVAVSMLVAPVQASKPHRHKKSGVKGVVRDSSCYGACAEPRPPEPVYRGSVTIEVRRTDGTEVGSQAISDGHFRIRVKPGTYDVSSVPPSPSPQPCPPGQMCPLAGGGAQASPAVVQQCLQGETKRVAVRRHRFRYVTLHVANTCIV
jgi:hypothetical protein